MTYNPLLVLTLGLLIAAAGTMVTVLAGIARYTVALQVLGVGMLGAVAPSMARTRARNEGWRSAVRKKTTRPENPRCFGMPAVPVATSGSNRVLALHETLAEVCRRLP